jgi:hypothetical protein
VRYADGRVENIAGTSLSPEISMQVFARTGEIERIDVHVPA